MFKSHLKIYSIGLIVYLTSLPLMFTGFISDIFGVMPSLLDENEFIAFSRYFINSMLIGLLNNLLYLIIDILIIIFSIILFKTFSMNTVKKSLWYLLVIFSVFSFALPVFLTVFGMSISVPQYLIFSEIGKIDMIITYIKPFLLNGTIFRIIGSILIFVGLIVFKKRVNL